MKLAEIMTKPPITVRDDVTADDVAARMISQRIGCLPVVDHEGQLVGIVTPCDFGAKEGSCPFPLFCASGFPGGRAARRARHAVADPPGLPSRTAREIMTPRPIVLFEDSTVSEAAAKMLHFGFDHIPVVRHGKPVGIVAREDLLRLALRSFSTGLSDVDRGRAPASATVQSEVRGESIPTADGARATEGGAPRAGGQRVISPGTSSSAWGREDGGA
jgi:CBS domain-containing protein